MPDVFQPREYQRDIADLVVGRLLDSGTSVTVADFVTGAGKEVIPQYTSVLAMRRDLIDASATIVPRLNLAIQAELNWENTWRQQFVQPRPEAFRHRANHDRAQLTGRDIFGYLTTTSSLVSPRGVELHLQWAKRHEGRFLLTIDEAQFCGAETRAGEVISRLMAHAGHTLILTGTPYRSDGRMLVGLEQLYEDHPDRPGFKVLRADKRVTYLDTVYKYLVGFQADFIEAGIQQLDLDTGELLDPRELAEFEEGVGRVIGEPRLWHAIVDNVVRRWRELCEVDPRIQSLIVCDSQNQARDVMRYLARHRDVRPILAVSDDGPAAHEHLRDFKAGRGNCLVTVAMAYVGFDCKPIKVIGALTKIRWRGWLAQMAGRGLRPVDGVPIKEQCVFVVGPADALFKAFCDDMRSDAEQGFRLRQEEEEREGPVGGGSAPSRLGTIVTDIDVHGVSAKGDDPTGDIDLTEYVVIEDAKVSAGLTGVPETKLKAFLDRFNSKDRTSAETVAVPTAVATIQTRTLKERVDQELSHQSEAINRIVNRKLGIRSYHEDPDAWRANVKRVTIWVNQRSGVASTDYIKASLDMNLVDRRWEAIRLLSRQSDDDD